MRAWVFRIFTVLVLLGILAPLRLALVYADEVNSHLLSPSQVLQQNQAVRKQQDLLQQQAGSAALKARGNALIRQCWALVEKKSVYGGPVGFQTADIDESQRLYVRGHVSFPNEKGHPVTYDYACRMDKSRRYFDSVEVDESDDD